MNKSLQDKLDWMVLKAIVYIFFALILFILWLKFSISISLAVFLVILENCWNTGNDIESAIAFFRVNKEGGNL
jgi:5-bromo-4-chloroindolyl phosphate hydrolysis protein